MSRETERLPTAEEIGDDSRDGRDAVEHFLGKTLAQAEALFAGDDSVTYTCDLMWMQPIGFRFYLRAAMRHALSDGAAGDADLINGLASAISFWYEEQPAELTPCARQLADFCAAVVEQFPRYEADADVYPGLPEQYMELAVGLRGLA